MFLMWFSLFALPIMVGFVAYRVGYRTGYGHGDHNGFGRGLWKSQERTRTTVTPDDLVRIRKRNVCV